MLTVSSLYRQIFKDPLHHKEVKIEVGGMEYTGPEIISVSVPAVGLYKDFGIGNTVSRQISLSFFQKGEIPKGAEIRLYIRLVSSIGASEWIPQGVFYISKRKTDRKSNVLSITGFDAMLRAEETWITEDMQITYWPWSQEKVIEDIAYRMGIEIDERTYDAIINNFEVDYPVDENGDLTMREILAGIATSNVANWVITYEGKLRLIGAVDFPAESFNLVNEYGETIIIGGVAIRV